MSAERLRRGLMSGLLILFCLQSTGCGGPGGPSTSRSPDSTAALAQPSPIPGPRHVARIAFSAALEDPAGGGYEIYGMSSNGADLVNLSQNPAWDSIPSWSPDGKRIVFFTDRGGSFQLYQMNADGSEQRPVTQITEGLAHTQLGTPAWSPDGKWIAVDVAADAPPPEGTLDVYLIRSDGSRVVNLTDHPANDTSYGWSPDSQRVVFGSDRDGNEEIYLTRIDGSGATRLTDNPARDGAAVFSPDGKSLTFLSNRDGNWEIYVMKADGSGQARLTDDAAADLNPAWSPDGSAIGFTSDRDGNTEVYRMGPDGSQQVNLTNSPENDYWFWWSHDGGLIAISSCHEGCTSADARWSTSIMDSDGAERHQILEVGATVSWAP